MDEETVTAIGTGMVDTPMTAIGDSPRVAEGKAPEALTEALRARMQEILKNPLSARSLLELEQMAQLSRSMLAISMDPQALAPKRVGANYIGGVGYQTVNVGANLAYGPESMTPAPQNETFGVKALKEIVAAVREICAVQLESRKAPEKVHEIVKGIGEAREQLISAIATARERGLDDIAKKLEKQLFDAYLDEAKVPEESTPPALPAAPASNGVVHPETAL